MNFHFTTRYILCQFWRFSLVLDLLNMKWRLEVTTISQTTWPYLDDPSCAFSVQCIFPQMAKFWHSCSTAKKNCWVVQFYVYFCLHQKYILLKLLCVHLSGICTYFGFLINKNDDWCYIFDKISFIMVGISRFEK